MNGKSHKDESHWRGAAATAQRPHLSAEAPGELPHAQDHWHVNLGESWEIAFWTRELGCTEARLRQAVEMAGTTAGAVKQWLRAENEKNF